mgnify:CR=1 FL=1|tara:strand:- start:558 stop:1007 length:450 start_codon:yes stop_codon:yes gene_type:complete
MTKVILYTDGACLGNPGAGGYAGLLMYGDFQKTYSGSEKHTTNNRMELKAAIEGLKMLTRASVVDVYTDSQYVRMGITSWMAAWKRKGWVKADKKPVKNVDLWKELDVEADRHTIAWHWVKGHSGVWQNEKVDQLAREAALLAKEGEHG